MGENPQDVMFSPDYEYSVGMDFHGHCGTTVIAEGLTFIIDGFMEPVSVSDCRDITLTGLTIDHKRKPFRSSTPKYHCHK